ncbi:hypothetical protein AZI87_17500 [Bdellovibrio bacteriovorus]|uniref:Uncharacterized protein n=1 Tax=Bdellovibrio bacteriovorus TaxID=959 RepID=A0A162FUG9_BDEBC|nr:hypothetical protein [Bdellovibrio bacteriovorus]KYG62319.1 hypothetical protein AZI87_17500 [Bdellovibrio bacteriovorus]
MKLLLISFTLLYSFTLFAGIRDVGSGGAGILKDNRIYLLDLYEVGLPEPLIDSSVIPDEDILNRAKAMPHFTDDESMIFAQKMTEIRRKAPRFANVLLLALSKYQWYLVDTPLAVIKEDTPLDLENMQLVQIANRLETRVRIYRPYWESMSPKSKVALVIHELVYSIHRPTMVSREKYAFVVDAVRVRSIVAWMLSEEFYSSTPETLAQMTNSMSNPAQLRDQYLLNLDADVVILNGYVELSVSTDFDRAFVCSDIERQVGGSAKVVVQRELKVSWSELFFSSYLTPEGLTQFTLRLSTRSLGDNIRSPGFWDEAILNLPSISFDSSNVKNCRALLQQSHEQSLKHFQEL